MDISTRQQFIITHKTSNGVEYTLSAIADNEAEAKRIIISDLQELLSMLE